MKIVSEQLEHETTRPIYSNLCLAIQLYSAVKHLVIKIIIQFHCLRWTAISRWWWWCYKFAVSTALITYNNEREILKERERESVLARTMDNAQPSSVFAAHSSVNCSVISSGYDYILKWSDSDSWTDRQTDKLTLLMSRCQLASWLNAVTYQLCICIFFLMFFVYFLATSILCNMLWL